MQRLYRLLSALLCAVFLTLSFLACAPAESDGELLSIIEELCEASRAVNDICFGEGILEKENGYSVGSYIEASEKSLAAFGVESCADIEAKMKKVYSTEICEWIKSTVFTSIKDLSTVASYRRYYDGASADGKSILLMVKKDYDYLAIGDASYGEYEIIKAKRNEVTFTATVTVRYGGETQTTENVSFSMIKEDGAWRLNKATYFTFVR